MLALMRFSLFRKGRLGAVTTRARQGALGCVLTCFMAASAGAETVLTAPPLPKPSTAVYQQISKDGVRVYSDKPLAGVKLERSISRQASRSAMPMIERSTGPSDAPAQITEVVRMLSITPTGRPKTIEEAAADILHAEMLLEDARSARDRVFEDMGASNGAASLSPTQRDKLASLNANVVQAQQRHHEALREHQQSLHRR